MSNSSVDSSIPAAAAPPSNPYLRVCAVLVDGRSFTINNPETERPGEQWDNLLAFIERTVKGTVARDLSTTPDQITVIFPKSALHCFFPDAVQLCRDGQISNAKREKEIQLRSTLESGRTSRGNKWVWISSPLKKMPNGTYQTTEEDLTLANHAEELSRASFDPVGSNPARPMATDIFVCTTDGDHVGTLQAGGGAPLRWCVSWGQSSHKLREWGNRSLRFVMFEAPGGGGGGQQQQQSRRLPGGNNNNNNNHSSRDDLAVDDEDDSFFPVADGNPTRRPRPPVRPLAPDAICVGGGTIEVCRTWAEKDWCKFGDECAYEHRSLRGGGLCRDFYFNQQCKFSDCKFAHAMGMRPMKKKKSSASAAPPQPQQQQQQVLRSPYAQPPSPAAATLVVPHPQSKAVIQQQQQQQQPRQQQQQQAFVFQDDDDDIPPQPVPAIVDNKREQQQQQHHLFESNNNRDAAPFGGGNNQDEDAIQTLVMTLQVTPEAAAAALRTCNGNINEAADHLMSPEEEQEPQQQQPARRNDSNHNIRSPKKKGGGGGQQQNNGSGGNFAVNQADVQKLVRDLMVTEQRAATALHKARGDLRLAADLLFDDG